MNSPETQILEPAPAVGVQRSCSVVWVPAARPPPGEPGKWTPSVVVVMRSGVACRLSYFRDDKTNGGRWQRLRGTLHGDEPMWWIDPPNKDYPDPKST